MFGFRDSKLYILTEAVDDAGSTVSCKGVYIGEENLLIISMIMHSKNI